MLQLEVFILERGPINRLPACAVSTSEVTPLAHKVGDDPMEFAVLEVQLPAGPADAPFARTQASEILACPWHYVGK